MFLARAARPALAAILLSCFGFGEAASAQPRAPHDGVEEAALLDNLQLDGELFHVQGTDLDERRIWVSSVDRKQRRGYLHEFDRATGKLLRRIELTDGARYHPGGISLSGHSLWVPVAEYKPNSSAALLEIDTESLRVVRRIAVADHLGCVAASDENLIAGNWDSKLLYVFDLNADRPIRVVPNPSPTRFQDMKLVDGALVASGVHSPSTGAIDWIDWRAMTVTRTLRTGTTAVASPSTRATVFTRAGMSLAGQELYLVPQDGPSRVFHFRLRADGTARAIAAR